MIIKRRIAELERLKSPARTEEELEAERGMVEEAERIAAERLRKIREKGKR